MQIKDKLAVVTGGARRVGRAIVEALAGDGARVVVHCHRSLEEARALARSVGGHVVQADLGRPEGAAELCARVLDLCRERELALWVNNASSFERKPFVEADEALWARTLQLELLSPAACARAIAPAMRRAGSGLIINLLDLSATQPFKGYAHHSVGKAALQMLTRSLALELAPEIRVCGISPGHVLLSEAATEAEARRLAERVPLGRLGSPADVALAVRFLVEAEYATGSVVCLDGGLAAASRSG